MVIDTKDWCSCIAKNYECRVVMNGSYLSSCHLFLNIFQDINSPLLSKCNLGVFSQQSRYGLSKVISSHFQVQSSED